MGDLVLLESEVNPVMSALLDRGLDVTALHNHFFSDQRASSTCTYTVMERPLNWPAISSRPLNLIGKTTGVAPASPPAASPTPSGSLDSMKLAQIVGQPGEQSGAVYKITIGRSDLKVTEMGAVINARMGLNTWAAFTGTNEQAAIAGDVAMLESEVTPVLKALRQNGPRRGGHPPPHDVRSSMIIFVHYWGTGPAETLAIGFQGRQRTSWANMAAPRDDTSDGPYSRGHGRALVGSGCCGQDQARSPGKQRQAARAGQLAPARSPVTNGATM